MNKTAIKNFAIWARNKLIADITYKAGLLGITENEIKSPLPQSTRDVKFFDIGTREPYSITGIEINQREKLTEVIHNQEKQSDYRAAFQTVVEEVAYTWFNRLIAVRFMEVNDYLPSRIRVLSSESDTKTEPDMVTAPFDTDLEFTPFEKDRIAQMTHDNLLDELFRLLFIKQCNALNAILPNLFEKTSDYTELLLNVSFTDKDGVVYHLTHDIGEEDFNVSKEGQVEIIGWLYQYYNTEPKNETFALLKNNVKITKERIPAATQLFTPDWIVRYMVENSLGRLWLERNTIPQMSCGNPDDAMRDLLWNYYIEEAEQEDKVDIKLNEIAEHNSIKEPNKIKFIDPCMGSGHILVYAFDVFMQIYLACGYTERDAASLIIEKNLYGVDIDKRAYQLAYFAVMMKGRQYDRRFLTKNIEPNLIYSSTKIDGTLAGKYDSKEILDYFKDAENAEALGSLIQAKDINFDALIAYVQNYDYFKFDIEARTPINTEKDNIIQNLKLYKILAQKYDVVCTNPPYMGSSGMNVQLSEFVKKHYPDSKSDLFAVFIEKCGEMLKADGYQAMITQHAWMFLSSYEKLREKLLHKDIINMAHLGARAFEEIGGEVVQTTAFVLRNSNTENYKSTYVRLVDYNSQQAKEKAFLNSENYYTAQKENFENIPGMPIAYWISEKMLKAFIIGKPVSEVSKGKSGQNTGDNNRFLRRWAEVCINKIGFEYDESYDGMAFQWMPYNKGGEYRRWYGNYEYVINWKNDGKDIKDYAVIRNNGKHWSRYIQNLDCLYKQGITWSIITSSTFSMRYLPVGFICDYAGCAIFPLQDDLHYLLALFNTKIAAAILKMINPTINYQPGNIGSVPYINSENYINVIKKLVLTNITISKTDWDSFETSWNFKAHPLVQFRMTGAYTWGDDEPKCKISSAFKAWDLFTEGQFNQLKANEEEINRIFIDIYGLQDELTPEVEDKDVTIRKADLGRDIRSFISYAVGCMFGRYSIYKDGLVYAGGNFEEYFELHQNTYDDLKETTWGELSSYTYSQIESPYYYLKEQNISPFSGFKVDADNCIPITDEEYFSDDIVGLFTDFVKKVYGAETLEENLDFIAKALGNKGDTSREIIRNYFLKDFYKDHCKVYQKRPIYWLFDSGKADGFKALIYMHRYDENTIGNLRIDYLHRMQRVYDSEITRMRETIENSANAREVAAAEKRREKLIKQLKETKEYDEKIAHLALARIAIDLDDGVKVNYEKVQTGTDGKKLEVLAKI